MKNKLVVLVQKDAHHGFVKTKFAQKIVWDILSYKTITRIKDWKRPKGFKIEEVERSFLDKRNMSYPFGLTDFVAEKLTEKGYEVEIQEKIFDEFEIIKPEIPNIVFEDYQRRILNTVKNNCRGIIHASTGSGKTISSAGIVSQFNYPVTLFVTTKKNLLNQTYEDFCKWFPDIDIGRIGDGHCEVGHITVALYQSLGKWDLKEYNKQLELVILDECHQATEYLGKILKQFTNVYYRFGLSATVQKIEKDRQKYFQMVGNIGDVIVEVTDEECSKRVTDVDLYMLKFKNENATGKTYQTSFREDVLLNPKRNQAIIEAADELLLSKGKSTLFMVSEIRHAKQLFYKAMEMGFEPKLVHGRNDSETNEEIKKLLNDKKEKFVIATGVLSTGANIPTLEGLVLCSERKSEISVIQTIGRVRRRVTGKDMAIVLDVYDIVKGSQKFHSYFQKYAKERLELYKEKGWFRGFL